MSHLLPKIIATLTQKPREIVVAGVDFDWDGRCWTHNAFRFLELVFGRKAGVRFEHAATIEHGREIHVFGTLENLIAFSEGLVRAFLKGFEVRFEVIPLPVLALPGLGGVSMPPMFNFAIAFDAGATATNISGVTTVTYNHTTSGANGIIFASTWDESGLASDATTASYNGTGLTAVDSSFQSGQYGTSVSLLVAPASGTNSMQIVRTSSSGGFGGGSTSYSGALQSGQPDNHSSTRNTATTFLTTIADNCWIMLFVGSNGDVSAGASTTGRVNIAGNSVSRGFLGDTNGPVHPAGSTSMTTSGGSQYGTVMVSIVPAVVLAQLVQPFRIFQAVNRASTY